MEQLTVKALFNLGVSVYRDEDKRIQSDGSISLFVIDGKNYDYSDTIRKSLIEGLAIISNKICNSCSCSSNVIRDTSGAFVRDVLANNTVSTWISIDTVLTTLAEVSPSRYLYELEKTINDNPEIIEALFPKRDTNLLMTRNPICSVLWSIEALAWIEE